MMKNPRDALRGQSMSTNMVPFWAHSGFSLQQFETPPRDSVPVSHFHFSSVL